MIFLTLAAQYNSFRDPFVILAGSVPLAMFGALIFSFLRIPDPNVAFWTDSWTTTMNIYSQVGLVTLVGVVSKNGILIVEFANKLQAQGMTKMDAIREACPDPAATHSDDQQCHHRRLLSADSGQRRRGGRPQFHRFGAGRRNDRGHRLHPFRDPFGLYADRPGTSPAVRIGSRAARRAMPLAGNQGAGYSRGVPADGRCRLPMVDRLRGKIGSGCVHRRSVTQCRAGSGKPGSKKEAAPPTTGT
jgi:hypothetical protein